METAKLQEVRWALTSTNANGYAISGIFTPAILIRTVLSRVDAALYAMAYRRMMKVSHVGVIST